MLDTFKCEKDELPNGACYAKFDGAADAVLVVGTSKGQSRLEADDGRVLAFNIVDNRLALLAEYVADGSVFTVNEVAGKLIATINGKVQGIGNIIV